ncbi:PREDICTED: uncharacterized protein LOC109156316 [Ipomoea nil]|uniref:uncharacterized protein LOC109156316 n=1 Tax=Ipomoea nil TaxID=35883 RepID=UPI000900D147|nr:PREDICTED: uncharacterized protein LOC109156316 [Ipomoea nil]
MEAEVALPPTDGGGARGPDGGPSVIKRFKQTKRSFAETLGERTNLGTDFQVCNEEINWFDDDFTIEPDKDDYPAAKMEGVPVVRLPKALREELIKPWKNALIVKHLGKPVGFSLFQQRMTRIWNLQGRAEFIDIGKGWYVLRFQLQTDCMHVLVDGPWKLFNNYVVARRWKPNFNPSREKVEKMAVWVRLPEFPVELFREDVIKLVLQQVGTPLKIDNTTAGVERGNFARAAVEVDISKPLVALVQVHEEIQKVEYEGLHIICFDCGEVGHRTSACPKNKTCDEEKATGDNATDGQESMNVDKRQEEIPTKLHGSWMGLGGLVDAPIVVEDTPRRRRGAQSSNRVGGPVTVLQNSNQRGKKPPKKTGGANIEDGSMVSTDTYTFKDQIFVFGELPEGNTSDGVQTLTQVTRKEGDNNSSLACPMSQ